MNVSNLTLINFTNNSENNFYNESDENNNYTVLSIILLIIISSALFIIVFFIIFIIYDSFCLSKNISHYSSNLKLKKNIFNKNSLNKLDLDCSICLQNNNKSSIKLNCNHVFHKECLEKLFTSGNNLYNFSGPLCRKEFNFISKKILIYKIKKISN
jgi:hypothetical protein